MPILSSVDFFYENCAINEIMWKTHKMHCCISTATMVMWTYHNLTLCTHCLSYLSNVRQTAKECILHWPIFFFQNRQKSYE